MLLFFLGRGRIFADEIVDGQTVISKHPSNYNLRLNLFYDGSEKVTLTNTHSGWPGQAGWTRGGGVATVPILQFREIVKLRPSEYKFYLNASLYSLSYISLMY